jgi:uroporphyrin-III C-methyltransferase
MERRGKVYLTGAGPGAADLLTLRAMRVLERADVVFHDSLVSDEVLQFCPPSCRIVAVGKRSGAPSPERQLRIHELLAEAARKYETVVRLKGGDPCVFGRGGEEVEFLVQQRIAWEVIPGISAGIGGLSALGLPLTHRLAASSITLLTGSQAISGGFGGVPPGLDGNHTLVFYMGLQHAAAIAEDLLRQGAHPATYALCASRMSCPDQRLLAAPLAQIGEDLGAAALPGPALLVVGNVVALWKQWIEQVP